MNQETARKALDLAIPINDAEAATVRDYLKTLLLTLLCEEEGFSGKRPFGNSGWLSDIMAPMIEAGLIPEEASYQQQGAIFAELVDALAPQPAH